MLRRSASALRPHARLRRDNSRPPFSTGLPRFSSEASPFGQRQRVQVYWWFPSLGQFLVFEEALEKTSCRSIRTADMRRCAGTGNQEARRRVTVIDRVSLDAVAAMPETSTTADQLSPEQRASATLPPFLRKASINTGHWLAAPIPASPTNLRSPMANILRPSAN